MQETVQDIHERLAMARLPALPQALLQVLELCDREDVGLTDVAKVVRQDTGIAARMISVANSSYYHRGRSLDNLDQCLAVLGTSTVRRIALNQSVVELFSRFQGARGFDFGQFWLHALRSALTIRHLAEDRRYGKIEEAYLAGLIHDVGQLALMTIAPDRYARLFDELQDERELIQQEMRIFGMTHVEAGAWMAERWHMDSLFVDSLLYHHEPLERGLDAHPLVLLVMLADRLAAFADDPEAVPDELVAASGLSRVDITAILEGVVDETRVTADQLGIELPVKDHPKGEGPAATSQAEARLADAVSIRIEARGAMPATGPGSDIGQARIALAQGANLIFGASAVGLFLIRDDRLVGQSLIESDSRIHEIDLRLPNRECALGRACEGEITLPESVAATHLVDEQVRRFLGGQRIVCLPLAAAGERLGVLVLGLDKTHTAALSERRPLLSAFATEAGRYLAQALKHRQDIDAAVDGLSASFKLHARRVAHEAGNPLSVVRNYLAILGERMSGQAAAQQEIQLIESELRRVGNILRDLKQVEPATLSPAVMKADANAVVEEVMQLCRMGKLDAGKIETELVLEPGLPPAKADGDKVRQILINLVYNALEAMPGDGRLAVSTAHWRGAKGEDTVEITVSDNGPGIPSEIIAHLYQPVESAKGGAHAGLGLSIVKKLVDELGGVLHCNSTKAGTSFKILLPVAG